MKALQKIKSIYFFIGIKSYAKECSDDKTLKMLALNFISRRILILDYDQIQ